MRSDHPVDETPTELYVKAFGRGDFFFANNLADTAGSTIAYADALRMPRRRQGQATPYFSDDTLAPILPISELEIDDSITCYRQSTGGDQGRAHFWTPSWLWDLASRDFVVIKNVRGHNVVCNAYAGIWALSIRYATDLWDGGVICMVGANTYTIMEAITDHKGNKHYVQPTRDPRLDRHELPEQYRDQGILPE